MKTIKVLAMIIMTFPALAFGQFSQDVFQKSLFKLEKNDEVTTVVELIKGDKNFDAAAITESLRQSYPAPPSDNTIRVFPYMRENLKLEGKEYERVKRVTDGLLKFMNLEKRIYLIYFTSEVPVTAFINPNVIAVSTAASDVMTDEEMEAVIAHEISHLVIFPYFKQAVDNKDNKQRRALELFCDAAAVSIIRAKGGEPQNLIKGLEKMLEVVIRVNAGSDEGIVHPTMKQRRKLLKQLSEGSSDTVAARN